MSVSILNAWTSQGDFPTNGHSMTPSAGSNRAGVVVITYEGDGTGGACDISAVTWGGETVTELHDFKAGTPTGFNDLVWMGTINESGIDAMSGGALAITFVNPNTGIGPFGNGKVACAVYENVDQADLVSDSNGDTTGPTAATAVTISMGVIDTDVDQQVIVAAMSGQGTTADDFDIPTGWTQEAVELGATNDHNMQVFSRDSQANDDTLNQLFTCASTNRLCICSISLGADGDEVLVADVGAYSLAGIATTFRLSNTPLIAALGTYALVGPAVNLNAGITLTAALGTYALAGIAVTFDRTHVLAATLGTYLLEGGAGGAPATIANYSESNRNSFTYMSSDAGDDELVAQSFTGDGNPADEVDWFLLKSSSPTGDMIAKIYAHTGTFGSTGVPTGAALATSNAIDASTLDGTYTLTTFVFPSPFTPVNGTKYFVSLEFSGGNIGNWIEVGHDSSAPTHEGNYATNLNGSTWVANAGIDAVFDLRTLGGGGGVNLLWDHQMIAALGTYSLAGIAVTLTHDTNIILTADLGTYTLAGLSTDFIRTYILVADLDTYSLAGLAVNLNQGFALIAALGTYSLAGIAVTLTKSGTVTGSALVVFPQSQISRFSRRFYSLHRGVRSMRWQISGPEPAGDQIIIANVGPYSLAAPATNTLWGHKTIAALGTYSLVGLAVDLIRGHTLPAALGPYSLAGPTTSLAHSRLLVAALGTYSLAGVTVELNRGFGMIAELGTYSLVGITVDLIAILGALTQTATYNYVGLDVELSHKGPNGWVFQGEDDTGWQDEAERSDSWVDKTEQSSSWTGC